MRLLLMVFMIACLASFCEAHSTAVYFPDDACPNIFQPQIPLKDGVTVYVGFNGHFGDPRCRTMSFQIPQSSFWKYKVCLKVLHYRSPKCESSVLFVPFSFKNRDNGGWIVSDYERQMVGVECPAPKWIINYNIRLEVGEKYCNQDFTGFDIRLSKGVKPRETLVSYWDNWARKSDLHRKTSTQSPVPDHIYDIFSIEITATLEYKVEVIAGICGGLTGLIVLVVILTRMCMCMHRPKRLTGHHIPKENYGDSCWKEKGKWWSRYGLDKTDVSPLIVHM